MLNLIGLVALGAVIEGRGGLRYLRAYVRKDPRANVDPIAVTREKMFEAMPAPPLRPIVFAGDSLTAQCEWWELLGHRSMVLNRGIGGDTSAGLLARIGEISRLHPRAVFLMIGANDGQLIGYSPADTIRTWGMIVNSLRAATPDVAIYAESVLPSRTPKFNRWGDEVNEGIRKLSGGKSVTFVDLRPAFLDRENLLDARYTTDGLHLSAEGYHVWKQRISPLLDGIKPDAGER